MRCDCFSWQVNPGSMSGSLGERLPPFEGQGRRNMTMLSVPVNSLPKIFSDGSQPFLIWPGGGQGGIDSERALSTS